jgi:hypothetical protein
VDKKVTVTEVPVEINELALSLLGWEVQDFRARVTTEQYEDGVCFHKLGGWPTPVPVGLILAVSKQTTYESLESRSRNDPPRADLIRGQGMWPKCVWRSKYTAVSRSARRQYRNALSYDCIELGDEVVAHDGGVESGLHGVAVFRPERPRQVSEPAGLVNGTGFGEDHFNHMRLRLSCLGFQERDPQLGIGFRILNFYEYPMKPWLGRYLGTGSCWSWALRCGRVCPWRCPVVVMTVNSRARLLCADRVCQSVNHIGD